MRLASGAFSPTSGTTENIEYIIPKDDSVRLLGQFVEEMDSQDLEAFILLLLRKIFAENSIKITQGHT
jgi:hypothetical protein